MTPPGAQTRAAKSAGGKGRIRVQYMALGRLEGLPRNAKLHDDAGLLGSFRRFGFTQPILIDEATGTVVAGHGRIENLAALKAEGAAAPARVEVRKTDWYVPVIRGVGFKTAAEAEAYALADNQLTVAGGWDEAVLAEIFQDLGELRDGLGFDPDYIDQVIREYSAPALTTKGDGGTEPGPSGKSDTMLVLGPYRIAIERERFLAWREEVGQAVGFEDEAVMAEMLRRLAL